MKASEHLLAVLARAPLSDAAIRSHVELEHGLTGLGSTAEPTGLRVVSRSMAGDVSQFTVHRVGRSAVARLLPATPGVERDWFIYLVRIPIEDGDETSPIDARRELLPIARASARALAESISAIALDITAGKALVTDSGAPS